MKIIDKLAKIPMGEMKETQFLGMTLRLIPPQSTKIRAILAHPFMCIATFVLGKTVRVKVEIDREKIEKAKMEIVDKRKGVWTIGVQNRACPCLIYPRNDIACGILEKEVNSTTKGLDTYCCEENCPLKIKDKVINF